MWMASEAPRTAVIPRFSGGTPSKRRSPAPMVTGTMWARISSMRPAARYWLTVAAPPAMATSRPPPGCDDQIDLGLVLIGCVEHPGVQPIDRPVAEWLFRGLARTGSVAVRRDRDVAEDLVGHGALRPRHLLPVVCSQSGLWMSRQS